ncbi:MAG: site-specific integrase [archaeon]|nr:site-specific integrase [archaeon]
MGDDKIDVHETGRSLEWALDCLQRNELGIPARSVELIKRFANDCLIGKTVLKRAKKKISNGRVLKYVQTLKQLAHWLGADFETATQDQMESLIRRIEANQLYYPDKWGNVRLRKYRSWSLHDFKVTLKKFYKWLLGNNEEYPAIVKWIDTNVEDVEIPAISLQEVERLVDFSPTVRTKALFAMLFETGARAEEMLNIRLRNLEDRGNYFSVRIEVSKTYPRTIVVYRAAKYLREWLSQHPGRYEQDTPLFVMKYSTMLNVVAKYSKKIIGRRISPHVLRHSCATWLASKGVGRYELCKWMGWTMSSDMPDRYIDRTGVVSEETMRRIRQDELVQARDEQKEMRDELQRLKQENETLRLGEIDDRGLSDLLKRDKGLLQQLAKEVARQNQRL